MDGESAQNSTLRAEQDCLFLRLPDELLQSVLAFLDATSLLAAQNTCHRLFELDSPLLWRQHCLSDYKYWQPHHDFPHLLRLPAGTQPWRSFYGNRKTQDLQIRRSVEEAISTSTQRMKHLQEVVRFGEDAKDVLYKMSRCPDDALDVLARRYWINEALGSIERTVAIDEWQKIADGKDVPLERALGAFDLFVCERPPETLDQISAHLDMLARHFILENPGQESLSTRKRALSLLAWYRSYGFRGVDQDSYYMLQNSLISVVLCDASHSAIPLTTVAIYCCIAKRLGIDAQPCGYPGHVLAMVYAPQGQNLDGEPASGTSSEVMYMDPFSDANELAVPQLREQLANMGASGGNIASFLRPTSIADIVLRTAANISRLSRNEFHTPTSRVTEIVLNRAAPEALAFHGLQPEAASRLSTSLYKSRSLYAVHWAVLLMDSTRNPVNRAIDGDWRDRLAGFIGTFDPDYRVDRFLLDRYVTPLFTNDALHDPERAGIDFLVSYIHQLSNEDNTPPTPSPRFGVPETEKVRYRIGQVFHHGKFNYVGAITGWDTQCCASDEWIRRMGVDRLMQGRTQCFYHIVADDQSTRYVAEENIELVYSNANGGYVGAPVEMPQGLEKVAGKWFRRWDRNRGRFVSNIEEEYPDD